MRFACHFWIVLFACLLPAIALADDERGYDFLPLAESEWPDAREKQTCAGVPACVVVAEKDPAQFSKSLRRTLRALPAPKLVEGLAWQHDRPAVTERVNRLVRNVLVNKTGHTQESARRLLHFALNQDDRADRSLWFFVLAHDAQGRAVLAEFIDAAPTRSLALAAMLQYVGSAPIAEGGAVRREQESKLKISRGDGQRIRRYSDEIWKLYTRTRTDQGIRKDERDDLALSAPLSEQVFIHVHECGAYQRRLSELVIDEAQAGKPLIWREVVAVSTATRHHADIRRRLMDWASSEHRVLRLLATYHLLSGDEGLPLQGSERTFFLDRLKPSQPVGRLSVSTFTGLLPALMPEMTPSEAAWLVRLAATAPKFAAQVNLLAQIGERIPEHRRPLVQVISVGSIDDARRTLHSVSKNDVPGLRRDLTDWLLALSPSQLAASDGRERFRTVLSWVDPNIEWPLSAVGPRQQWRGGAWCGTGSEQWAERRQSQADLVAFGLSVPDEQNDSEDREPREAELSAQERTVQQHQWAFALKTVQEQLRQSIAH
jgi:hypothetical protein